jgi:CRP-like cAMP-binding protein
VAAEVVDTLARVPLLSGLNKRELRRLAREFRPRRVAAGTTVMREGQMSGADFFVIVSGEAAVNRGGAEITRLGPGDYFGELALISKDVRTATVTAITDLDCLVTALWSFRQFVMENADVAWKLIEHLGGLLDEQRKPAGESRPSAAV